MKKKDIGSMSPDEMKSKIAEMQRELNVEYGTRATAGGKSRNYGKIRTLRKMVARIHTITRARELGLSIGKVGKQAAAKPAVKSAAKPTQSTVKPESNKKD